MMTMRSSMNQKFVNILARPVHSALESVAGSIIHLSRDPTEREAAVGPNIWQMKTITSIL